MILGCLLQRIIIHSITNSIITLTMDMMRVGTHQGPQTNGIMMAEVGDGIKEDSGVLEDFEEAEAFVTGDKDFGIEVEDEVVIVAGETNGSTTGTVTMAKTTTEMTRIFRSVVRRLGLPETGRRNPNTAGVEADPDREVDEDPVLDPDRGLVREVVPEVVPDLVPDILEVDLDLVENPDHGVGHILDLEVDQRNQGPDQGINLAPNRDPVLGPNRDRSQKMEMKKNPKVKVNLKIEVGPNLDQKRGPIAKKDREVKAEKEKAKAKKRAKAEVEAKVEAEAIAGAEAKEGVRGVDTEAEVEAEAGVGAGAEAKVGVEVDTEVEKVEAEVEVGATEVGLEENKNDITGTKRCLAKI